MYNIIEKHLKEQFNRIVFIELKKEANIETKFEGIKGIPIPILVTDIIKSEGKDLEANQISLASMARGMIYSLGLDSSFKYKVEYINFLYAFDEQIEEYISFTGAKLAEEKQLVDALIFFKSLITINDNNINGLYNYAKCAQDMALETQDRDKIKDLERESMKTFELLVEKYPDFAPPYYYLGFHYVNLKLFKKASLTWEKSIELDLDDEKRKEIIIQIDKIKDQVEYEEGYNKVLNNQPQKGLDKLLPLAERYSDWWNLLFFIGLAYRQLQNYNDAIEYFKKVLTVQPTQGDTLNELGLCYSSIGDLPEAEKYFKKALKFNGDDSEILSNLAILYMETGRFQEAKETFEKSLEINPEDEITRKCIERLSHLMK